MTSIHYYISPFQSGLTDSILSEVVTAIRDHRKVDFLLPSVGLIRDTQRRLLPRLTTTQPGQLYFGTFLAWADRILNWAREVIRVLPSGDNWLCLYAILKSSERATEWLSQPGSITALQSLFNDFRQTGLSQSELQQLLSRSGDRQEQEYFEIFTELEKRFRKEHWGPASYLIARAKDKLASIDLNRGNDLLVVMGFYEFNPLQERFVRRLTEKYGRAIFGLEYSDRSVFSYCRNLVGFVGKGQVIRLQPRPAKSKTLNNLRHSLFAEKEYSKISTVKETWQNAWDRCALKIVATPNRRGEIETAAKTVKAWIGAGMEPERIALTFRGAYDYFPLIRLVFRNYGLPIDDSPAALRDSEPARLVSRILHLNLAQFGRDALFDTIRLTCLRSYYGEEILQEFERLSMQWGVPRGVKGWRQNSRQRRQFLDWVLENRPAEYETNFAQFESERRRMGSVLPIVNRLTKDLYLPEKMELSQYNERITGLLGRYFDNDDREDVRLAITQLHSLLKIPLREGQQIGQISLAGLNLVWVKLLENQTFGGQPEGNIGPVTVPLMDIRGLEFDGLILLGMIDSEFPILRRQDALLSDTRRRELNRLAGATLFPLKAVNMDEEKLLFYLALHQAQAKLLLTYPEDCDRGISPFVDELIRCCLASDPPADFSIERIPPSRLISPPDQAYSEQELLGTFYSNKFGDYLKPVIEDCIGSAGQADIRRRIELEKYRENGQAGPWSGVLCGSEFPQFIDATFSVTRLQEYAWCPFLYLCRNIWNIFSPEEPQMDLAPLDDGLLIHKLLEAVVRQYLKQEQYDWNTFLTRLDDDRIGAILAELSRTYRSRFRHIADIIWRQKMAGLRAGLQQFIQVEIQFAEYGFAPFAVEKKFRRLPVSLTIDDSAGWNVEIRGKVDRLDRDTNGRFVVIEYKRSGASTQSPQKGVEAGIYFQIPVYIAAMMKSYPGLTPAGAFSYAFREGRRSKGMLSVPLMHRSRRCSTAEIIRNVSDATERIGELLRDMYRGNFLLKPYDYSNCNPGDCPYFLLCRIRPDRPPAIEDENEVK